MRTGTVHHVKRSADPAMTIVVVTWETGALAGETTSRFATTNRAVARPGTRVVYDERNGLREASRASGPLG